MKNETYKIKLSQLEKIKGHLLTLKDDCETNENSLQNRNDVYWDVYDYKNWRSMRAAVDEILNCLEGVEK
jgi:hypothetical protein